MGLEALAVYLCAGVVFGAGPASVRLSAVSADQPFRLGAYAAECGYCVAAAALRPVVVWDWVVRL
jgi:hypothetical protein